jgi:hypothetical protein
MRIDPLRVLLAILAAYRLAELVSLDDGPGDVFLRLRTWAGSYVYGEDGRPATSLGRLLACPFCVGVYAALGVLALVLWPSGVGDALLLMGGLAGGQCLLESMNGMEGRNGA